MWPTAGVVVKPGVFCSRGLRGDALYGDESAFGKEFLDQFFLVL